MNVLIKLTKFSLVGGVLGGLVYSVVKDNDRYLNAIKQVKELVKRE